ncbi:hypothetical protein Csa_022088 [Cucumis sativus]|uniref:Uncharacterized protein n=1 Tax=Cucumis sativus TaxID=3659 RepID=A0A0A0LRH2_CUCSA|nr:hypothetical protein Csa_022088 [Cucumis sativus]
MGKKKTQKTKEIAVAIAETSTSKLADDGIIGQPIQPRKRGRPRKVLEEQQNEQESKKPPPPLLEVAENPPEKKIKGTVDEAALGSMIEGSKEEEPKTGDGSRSRGRRKNKPRKSS